MCSSQVHRRRLQMIDSAQPSCLCMEISEKVPFPTISVRNVFFPKFLFLLGNSLDFPCLPLFLIVFACFPFVFHCFGLHLLPQGEPTLLLEPRISEFLAHVLRARWPGTSVKTAKNAQKCFRIHAQHDWTTGVPDNGNE